MGKQKENCSVFTPNDIVMKMLDLLDYKKDLYGKKVLENSCGDGNFLVEIVKRYIVDCQKQGLNNNKIRVGLSQDVVGFEVDNEQLQKCIQRLNKIADEFGILNVKWNIRNEDVLKAKFSSDFRYAVGNPPYITYSALALDNRKYIKENFSVCQEGKPDYYYAFIELAIKHLSCDGKFAYIVPSNFFKTKFAKNLRTYLLPILTDVYDYKTEKLFSDILTSSAIVCCNKKNAVPDIQYHDMQSKAVEGISKKALSDRWIFDSKKAHLKNNALRFGDYFSASSSIATLCNEVFVINQDDRNATYTLEDEILREAASPKSLANQKKRHIIFPYFYDEKNCLKHYSDKEFRRLFPKTTKYLIANKTKLDNRDSDKSAQWYEYGRSQALAHLNQSKLLISTLVTKIPKVFFLSHEVIPYSGIYIVPISNRNKNDNINIDLYTAKSILESDEFLLYVNRVGIHANGTSIRIAISDINNFTFSLELLDIVKSKGETYG